MKKRSVSFVLMLLMLFSVIAAAPTVSAASGWYDVTSDSAPLRSDCKQSASVKWYLSRNQIIYVDASVTNSKGNLWYKTQGGYLFSGHAQKHTNHNYTTTYVSRYPTCMAAGETVHRCVCGASYTTSIPAVGHNYSSSTHMCTYGCGNYDPNSVTTLDTNWHTLCINTDGAKVHSGPYGDCKTTSTLSRGIAINSNLTVKNGFGNTWYRLTSGGYIVDGYVTVHDAHIWNSGKITKNPTCQATGVKTYTCTLCGATRTESVPVVGHNYSSSTHMCTYGCGYYDPNSVTTLDTNWHTLCINTDGAKVHSGPYGDCKTTSTLSRGMAINSNLTVKNGFGNTWYRLTSGGYIVDGYVTVHDAHIWNSGKITKNPTCQATGVKTYTCTLCGATRTESVSTVGHSYSSSNYMCTYGCGNFNPASVKVTSASCNKLCVTSDGAIAHSGPYGDCKKTASYAKGTMLQTTDTVQNGYGHKWYRLNDGSYIFADYVTVHNSHTWNSGKITKNPTCQATGVKTYTCTVCGQTKTESIPAVAHNYSTSNFMCTYGCGHYNPASVTVTSYDSHTLCLTSQAKTHNGPYGACADTASYAKGTLLTATRTLRNGYGNTWYQLSNGSYIVSDYVTIHDNHTWNGGSVTKSPTCQTNGVKTFTCTLCGTTRTESIPAVGHQFDANTHQCVYGCGNWDPAYAPSVVTITSQPSNVSGAVDDTATFSVKASGAGLSYQWYYKRSGQTSFSAWPNRTTATVSAPIAANWNGAYFYCVVKDSHGNAVRSDTVKLTVLPKITSQPVSFSGTVGSNASFTVKATGSGLTYRWYIKKPGETSFRTWGEKAAATASTPIYASWNGTQVYCIVKDTNGRTVKSNTVKLTVLPKITSQPKNVSGVVNYNVSFAVKATGTKLTYQWYYKKTGESGFTAWNERTAATATGKVYNSWNGAQFYCVVKDVNGKTVRSDTVKLTVVPMKITQQPANASGTVGSNASFTVKAQGSGLTYQWYYKKVGESKFTAWNNHTTAGTSFPVYASWQGARFYCVVKDANGRTLQSNTVKLVVTPKITSQPKAVTAKVGGKAAFSVKATGAGLSYQWYYKKSGESAWTKWNGQTGSSASLTAYKSWNSAQFYCAVKDVNGKTVKSTAVKLTVK